MKKKIKVEIDPEVDIIVDKKSYYQLEEEAVGFRKIVKIIDQTKVNLDRLEV